MRRTIAIDARKLSDFGIGTYVRHLIDHLGELDGENQYLLFVRPGSEEELDSLPINFELLVESSRVYSASELLTLSWRLFRRRVDLYHATHYVLPGFLPCKTVVTIHDIIHLLFPDFLPNRLALRYARTMIRRSLARGDRIIAVSRNTRDDLLANFAVSSRKIEVIHNGVADVFRQHPSEQEIASHLEEFGVEGPYMLFVGNPKPHKNLDRVVKAFARARKDGALDAKLVCAGAREGSDFKIRQRAEQLGIQDDVKLLGHVSDEALPALYGGAKLFLYPTLYEGFGLPVLEAMASGTPVLTSNNSALKEIAGGYARLVEPVDVDDIARAMLELMNDDDELARLSQLGLERAEDFRWQSTAQRTLDVYRSVLES